MTEQAEAAPEQVQLIPQHEWEPVRQSLGLTATEVEKRTGVKSGQLRRWERGATGRPAELYRFALAFTDLVRKIRAGEPGSTQIPQHAETNNQLNGARAFAAQLQHYVQSSADQASPEELRLLTAELDQVTRRLQQSVALLNGMIHAKLETQR